MKRTMKFPFARLGLGRLAAPALVLLSIPALLSAQTLQHRYSFVSDASDSVGNANGTVVAPNGGASASIANGLQLPGSGGGFGTSGYVSFPSGILTTTTNLTIEVWATQNSANTWATIWDFSSVTAENFAFCPYPNRNGNNPIVANSPNNNEVDLNANTPFPNGSEQYVTFTYNSANFTGTLYTNGVAEASVVWPNATYTPGTIGGTGGTIHNMLGNDIWGDPQFNGTVYEFRIWNGVVPQRYIAAAALVGPGTVVNNITPTSAALAAGSAVVISGTEQAVVTVQLTATGSANLVATGDATNWVSSNPSVIKVNSSGLITGVAAGTATVSATVGGITSTSGPITVTPQALIHRYSFASDATDSVGGANGTLVAGTSGTNATINNGLILPGNRSGGNGYSGYVSLPQGVLTNTTSVTVECWLTQNQGNTWAEAWDFGINNQAYNFSFIPYPADNNNNPEVANFDNNGNDYIRGNTLFPNGTEQYVAVTYNNSSLVGTLYTNGVSEATTTYPSTAYAPGLDGGAAGSVNNYLGNDIYGDWQFSGTIYEFRIWNGAVSPVYVAASQAAGPSVVITNTAVQSLAVGLTSTSLLGSGTEQASATASFLQIANVVVTPAVTNWTSSNPSILSVSSSGLITGLSGGTATVSATVNGVTATSATITVQNTAPNPTAKPVNESVVVTGTATFNVAALGGNLSFQWSFDGTPITGATNSTLTLTNVSFNEAGTYTVAVANTLGTTNLSAVLTVLSPVLEHRYSFISDASDSVGGANGTVVAPNGGSAATIANGLVLPGGGGGGYSGYVTLPAGILTNTTSLTVEVWVTQNTANGWATIWDFANNTSQNFEMCPNPQRGINNLDVAIEPNGGEIDTITSALFPSGTEQYAAFTFDAANLTGEIYTNGLLAATQVYPNATYIPGTIGGAAGTAVNALGNDIFNDSQFQGTIYEFRIWNGPVSPLYLAISQIAGPSVVVTNLTPASVSVTVNTTMVAGQSQQASASGNFLQASGVVLTGAVTNWVSSNPSILTVNSNGLITAVGLGSATVSATVNGITGVSAAISVPSSPPVITAEPPAAISLLAGATLDISVSNIGSAPITYTWYLGSQVISGATSATLTIPDVQAANAGSYTCVLHNAYGNATTTPTVLTVVTPTAYQAALISYSPLGYWPLNETSGSIAYDLAGGDNGTYNGSVLLGVAGPTNASFGNQSYGVGFDGSTAYVDIPEGPFNITGAITTMIWIYDPYASGFDGIFGHGDASWRMSINPSLEPGANDGDGVQTAGDATSPYSINDGNWHQVVYTYTGQPNVLNNGTLYVDGVAVAFNTLTATPPGDNLDVWIGGSPDYPTARLTSANLADAAVFNYALSQAQVTDIYTAQVQVAPGTLTIVPSGKNVVVSWSAGTLQQATSLTGPWTTVSGAATPYTVPATNSSEFYRVH